MTGVLERRALRTQLKQQDRTWGHRAPVLSCSGRLPSVSGTIKIFKRPVQITCCRAAWLLSRATTVCHAEKCVRAHTNARTLHADRTVPRGARRPADQRLTIRFTLTGVRHIKVFCSVAWGHVTEGPYISLYSCRLCLNKANKHIFDITGGHKKWMCKKFLALTSTEKKETWFYACLEALELKSGIIVANF